MFARGTNGNLLSSEDIENNPSLKVTTLHESIHAIFNRLPAECVKQGLSSGSGMHLIYRNPRRELGRGFNEGFTNWVCEKAGLKPNSYTKFTNIIRILEMAIGPEKVMQFGKGDIEKNVASLLGMSFSECALMLSKADTIYDYDDIGQDYFDIEMAISNKRKFEEEKSKNPDAIMPTYVAKDLELLGKSSLYQDVLSNYEYISFVNRENLNPYAEESREKFFSSMHKLYTDTSKKLLEEIQSEIVSRYFMKEFEEVEQTGTCTIEQYQRFSKLTELLYAFNGHTNDTLKAFDEKFEKTRTVFWNSVSIDLQNSIQDGTLSIEKVLMYDEIFKDGDYKDSYAFREKLAKLILPEEPNMYVDLFGKLSAQNRLPEIFNYKLLELQTQNGSKADFFWDTQNGNHFSRYIQPPKIFSASEEIENPNNIIDITLNNLQSMQEIVKNFLNLKEKIKQKAPNTQIQIVDNIIVTTAEGENPSFYMVEGNDIVPAFERELVLQYNLAEKSKTTDENEITSNTPLTVSTIVVDETIPRNIRAERSSENDLEPNPANNLDTNYLKPVSKNPFKRFFQKLKQKVFGNKVADEVQVQQLEQAPKPKVYSTETFDDRLHVDLDTQRPPTQQLTAHEEAKNTENHDLSK